MGTKKFSSEFSSRGTVKVTDKLLITNIDTGASEVTTVAALLAAFGLVMNGTNLGLGTTASGSNLSVVSVTDVTIPALGAKGGQFSISVSQLYGLNTGVLSSGATFLQAQRMDGDVTAYNILLQPIGGNVSIGTAAPNANAILDVSSITKAFMPPRMTTAQRDAISTPTEGMVIYNLTTHVLNFHNGTNWGAV